MKSQIVLGPYLLPGKTAETAKSGLLPLGITLEWATTTESVRIPLYRYHPPHCTRHTRLEHIVVSADRLAIPLECPRDHVITTNHGVFIPLEALLLALYRTRQVQRPVFAVLEELAAHVQLRGAVSKPIPGTGFLVPEVEGRGFRLNTVIHTPNRVVGEIGWEPPNQDYRYHVCLWSFKTSEQLGAGTWIRPEIIGVSMLLVDELQRIVEGPPRELLARGASSAISAAGGKSIAYSHPRLVR